MIQQKRRTYSSSCLSINPAPFKWNVNLEFTGFTVPFSLNGIGDLNTYFCVKLSSILLGVDEASISHVSVTDSANSLGMPLNWDLMLSRPLAMDTGSSGHKVRSQCCWLFKKRVTWLIERNPLRWLFALGMRIKRETVGQAKNRALWNLRTEDGILAIVGIGLLGRLKLVELEDIINKGLLAGGWSTRWVVTLR